MNKSTSLYLDFLRVFAAFGVLVGHANFPWFSNNLFPGDLGHRLVLIFFVLSGYLITFTVHQKDKGPKQYLIDRISRLYSVVIPALIFTYLIDFVGRNINPGFYLDKIAHAHQALRFLLNLTFLQQIWGLSSAPSSNGPFWSIAYEFWYYILFGIFYYFKGVRRNIGLIVVCLVIGVKILLLLPVWLFGVLVYKCHDRYKISSRLAGLIFSTTLIILCYLTFFWEFSFFSEKFVFGQAPLYFSSNFIFDWVYGWLVAVNILSFGLIHFSNKAPFFIEKGIKYLSSITFSLYLYHLPILVFLAAILPYNKSSYFEVIPMLIGVVFIASLLSLATEKQRGHLKSIIEKIFSLFRKLIPVKSNVSNIN